MEEEVIVGYGALPTKLWLVERPVEVALHRWLQKEGAEHY